MTIPSLDQSLGAVDPQVVAITPVEGLAVPQVVSQTAPPQSVEQTDFRSASPLDPEAVARFREVLDAPLADNVRLQDQLARAVAYVATASTAIESAGALPVAEVPVERQSAMPQTELGPAPALANVTPNNRPAVVQVAREDVPTTAEHPVVDRSVAERPTADRPISGRPVVEQAVVRDDDSEVVVLQVLPQGAVVQVEGGSPVRESAPVVAPVAVEHVARAETAEMQMLVAAANEVADAILVSPGLLRGQGEMLVRLKPDVLSGSEIRIEMTGRTLSVEFQPTVQDVAVLIERNLPGLQERLAMNIAAFDVAVSVRPNAMAGRGRARKTEEDV